MKWDYRHEIVDSDPGAQLNALEESDGGAFGRHHFAKLVDDEPPLWPLVLWCLGLLVVPVALYLLFGGKP